MRLEARTAGTVPDGRQNAAPLWEDVRLVDARKCRCDSLRAILVGPRSVLPPAFLLLVSRPSAHL